MRSRGVWCILAAVASVAGMVHLAPAPEARAGRVPVIAPLVLAVVPREPVYSESLEFDGPALYESTGLAGKSQLRQVDPSTGQVLRSVDLPPTFFGEGITVVGEQIWQLTYENGVAIAWDKASFTPVRQVAVDGQGWGLCRDGNRLIRSDGGDRLRFHDINTFAETGGVTVTRDGQPVGGLNDLECVGGQVWAAAWPTDQFVRVDPATGVVNLVLDASNLWRSRERRTSQLLSGIAHFAGDEFLISAKDWPEFFRVRVDQSLP